MIRHRIIWTLKDGLSEAEKAKVKIAAKDALEGLCGVIPGLREMKITISPLAGSTGDMMLDSLFDTEEDLRCYSKHPAHVQVADTFVRPFTQSRACMDYESEE